MKALLEFSRATPVLVQGASGRMGRRHTLLMRDYGTNIVAGTSVREAGGNIEGIPLFASSAEAVARTGASASICMVPPLETRAAVEEAVAASPIVQGLLGLGRGVADALRPGQDWFVEMHQFRIEAEAGAPGYPTPEGTHHDGVDVVLIAMLARTNLAGGETLVTDDDGRTLARFTLLDPLDTALVDDVRVMHGVTPVQPADPARPSCRDVLVLTWKRGPAPG